MRSRTEWGFGSLRLNAVAGVIEAVDVLPDLDLSLVSGLEDSPPDEFRFHCLKHGFDHGIIVAIALARHGQDETLARQ